MKKIHVNLNCGSLMPFFNEDNLFGLQNFVQSSNLINITKYMSQSVSVKFATHTFSYPDKLLFM